VAGRFPLLTDENVLGPLIEGLRARGWDLVRTVDVFGERSVDETIFAFAAEHGRVLASTDRDCLAIAGRWIQEGKPFRLIYWHPGRHQRGPIGPLIDAFEALAAKPTAFACAIEYLKPKT